MIIENLKTEVYDEFEIAICGGGIAGISAALAAARQGKRVVLIENQFMLGGLATVGLVTIYLPLCDGMGHQVTFGIAEELLRLSIKYGAEDKYPENWLDNIGTRTENDKRFQVQYNPQLFAIVAEQELLKAGVEILYGSHVVAVHKINKKIDAVIVENKTGRMAYSIKSVIDATGDCDIAKFAEAPTKEFSQGNILAAWYYSVGKTGYNLNALGACDIPEEEKTNENKVQLLNNRKFKGLEGKELSEMAFASHDVILNDFIKKRNNDKIYWPVSMATIPQIRMTRRIVGEYELSHTEMHKEFEDSVGLISNWKKRGPIYEVPFKILYCKDVQNLIFAGRCTSVSDTMWDIMRVIPCCAVTGEAAGIAAALTDDFTSINIKALQNTLQKNGVTIHEKDLK